MKNDFDSIRPFRDEEVHEILISLVQEPDFEKVIGYAFPDNISAVKNQLTQIFSIKDFQSKIISSIVKNIIQKSIDEITVDGLENIPRNKASLIISNHRDIILDSALLNYELFLHGFPTTRIAIGSNLLQKKWIEQLVRLNKNFIVNRNIAPRQAYEYSLLLSSFIQQSVSSENESIWIAQREGRTKDGDDRTQAGLLKMLGLANEENGPDAYVELNIIPLSISYEYEPCAGMKAYEMFIRERDKSYSKVPGEDLHSMKKGIEQPKGNVSLSFGRPISSDEILGCFQGKNRNDSLKDLAHLIDLRIWNNFKLFPFHYIAADRLSENPIYHKYYNREQEGLFDVFLEKELSPYPGQNHLLVDHFLKIYANPLARKKEEGMELN